MRAAKVIGSIVLFGLLATTLYAADITGKWAGASEQGEGFTFNFKAEGAKLTGSMVGRDGAERVIKDGKIDGDAISFSVDSEWQGNPVKLVMKGKVVKEEIQLRIDSDDGNWGTDLALKRVKD